MANSDGGIQKHRVAVVGGGLAGLAAARMLSLHADFSDVVVLEAAPTLGGRIKHITGLVPWPVEVGPEFLHGKKNSSVKLLADEMGCQLRELPYHCYYLGHEGRMLSSSEANEHPDIMRVHEIFLGIAEEDSQGPDISMAEYLQQKGANQTVFQLAQSIYANDFGCSLAQLGVRECIQEAHHWIYGDTYLILDRPISSIIDHLSQGLNVQLNWPVEQIEYSVNGGVRLKSQNGLIVRADYVILTVPVTMMQQGVVEFQPPLPPSKLKAANAIGMSTVLKVLLAFSQCFWPQDLFDVVCSDCFLPEIWMTRYPPSQTQVNQTPPLGKFVIAAFIAGQAAVAMSKLTEEEIFRRALSQLDGMFGKANPPTVTDAECQKPDSEYAESIARESLLDKVSISVGMPHRFFIRSDFSKVDTDPQNGASHPASVYFQGGCIFSWANEMYVRGGYTHPSIKADGARSTLAEPLAGRLFFAGEATHPGVNPCMQAALDTGRRAAVEILCQAKTQ